MFNNINEIKQAVDSGKIVIHTNIFNKNYKVIKNDNEYVIIDYSNNKQVYNLIENDGSIHGGIWSYHFNDDKDFEKNRLIAMWKEIFKLKNDIYNMKIADMDDGR